MPDAFEMPIWAIFGISAVAAYFLGCFNGAVIVSKYILRDDVRTHGSGNAGLTNFYRTFGGPLTAVVILTDVLKAVLAVLLSRWLMFHGFTSPPRQRRLFTMPSQNTGRACSACWATCSR